MAKKTGQEFPALPKANLPEDGIGQRIKEARERLGMNFEELSRLTADYDAPEYKQGISAAMLARYERGAEEGKPVLPGARELRILCEALGVRADWLLMNIEHKERGEQAMELVDDLRAALQRVAGWKEFPHHDDAYQTLERQEKLRRARTASRKTKS